jgi:hypothetical protein
MAKADIKEITDAFAARLRAICEDQFEREPVFEAAIIFLQAERERDASANAAAKDEAVLAARARAAGVSVSQVKAELAAELPLAEGVTPDQVHPSILLRAVTGQPRLPKSAATAPSLATER